MRYLQIDGLRGIMLISMVLSHLGAGLPLGLTQSLVFKSALLNDAASAFVFLSGLTVGLVYTRGWIDSAYEYRKKALTRRTLLVFGHHLFLVIVATATAALMLNCDHSVWIIQGYGTAPIVFGLLSTLMLAGGWCLDILPMYVFFLLLTPIALTAIIKGHRWVVIAIVVAAWCIGQTGLIELLWDSLEVAFQLDFYGIDLGLEFNRLSWSALYFSGLLLGSAYVRGELELKSLQRPRFVYVLLVCLLVIAGLMFTLAIYMRGVTTFAVSTFAWLVSKPGFGFLAMLNFIAMTFVVSWLLVAGPSSPYRTMQLLGTGLKRLLVWSPLVLLGQHSLGVFTFHLIGVYAFHLLIDPGWFNPWSANAALLLGVLSLGVPVWFGQALKKRKQKFIRLQPLPLSV